MKRKADMTVDFNGVESGGSRAVPDDTYLVEVVSVEDKESGEGNPYLAWKWKIIEGPYKGTVLYDNTSLKTTALWRLKGLLECLGYTIDGKFALNLAEYKGKRVHVETGTEQYQGKDKSRITGFLFNNAKSAAASGGTTKPKIAIGTEVSFNFEGDEMTGTIEAVDGKKVSVKVMTGDGAEVWEMELSEVKVINKTEA